MSIASIMEDSSSRGRHILWRENPLHGFVLQDRFGCGGGSHRKQTGLSCKWTGSPRKRRGSAGYGRDGRSFLECGGGWGAGNDASRGIRALG